MKVFQTTELLLRSRMYIRLSSLGKNVVQMTMLMKNIFFKVCYLKVCFGPLANLSHLSLLVM